MYEGVGICCYSCGLVEHKITNHECKEVAGPRYKDAKLVEEEGLDAGEAKSPLGTSEKPLVVEEVVRELYCPWLSA